MSDYYMTNPADPDAPVKLDEHNGIRTGDHVAYANPEASWLPPLGPLVVDAIYEFPDNGSGGWVTVILNDGTYEVNADNLRRVESGEGKRAR